MPKDFQALSHLRLLSVEVRLGNPNLSDRRATREVRRERRRKINLETLPRSGFVQSLPTSQNPWRLVLAAEFDTLLDSLRGCLPGYILVEALLSPPAHVFAYPPASILIRGVGHRDHRTNTRLTA
jgi:hypothetical protein